MGTKRNTSLALLVLLNLQFFSLVSAGTVPPNPNPSSKPKPKPKLSTSYHNIPLKLGVCGNLLNGLLIESVGTHPKTPCCSLIVLLPDLEAAVSLCLAIKANILGINLNIPLSLGLLLNVCNKKLPAGFACH